MIIHEQDLIVFSAMAMLFVLYKTDSLKSDLNVTIMLVVIFICETIEKLYDVSCTVLTLLITSVFMVYKVLHKQNIRDTRW